jgi:hypothetical protein
MMHSALLSVLLLVLAASSVSAHVCLYVPQQRLDSTGNYLTSLLWEQNAPNVTNKLNLCKRNVNISPFANLDSPQYGSVCGGNSNHPAAGGNYWNQGTVPAANVFAPGSQVTLQILQNAQHSDPTGARSHYHRIEIAPMASPTSQSDFLFIADVPGTNLDNDHITYTWNVPGNWNIPHATLRVMYFTADTASPHPASSGVSNVYTMCADVAVQRTQSTTSSYASAHNIASVLGWMMTVVAVLFITA